MTVGDAHVFPGFLTPALTQLSFHSHRLLFSHASAEMRGDDTPETKFASNGYQTHNHQDMNPTHSPLSQPGRLEAGGRANDGVDTNPVTLPAQLNTKTINCRSERR